MILFSHAVKRQIRLASIIIFYRSLQAKKGSFLDFNVITLFKMRVLLKIRVLLEGKPHNKFCGNQFLSHLKSFYSCLKASMKML